MPSPTTPPQTFGPASGTFDGLDATLQATAPGFATDSFKSDIALSTGGVSPEINIAFVVDTSGSTDSSTGIDYDGDGESDTFLQAQVFAINTFLDQLIEAGYTDEVQVTLVDYASTTNSTTVPLADQQAIRDALNAFESQGSTRYDRALQELEEAWDATQTSTEPGIRPVTDEATNLVYFLSDGDPNPDDQDYETPLESFESSYPTTTIAAVGFGDRASEEDLDVVDNREDGTGTALGSTIVRTEQDIIDLISGTPVPLPELENIQVFVDGELLETIAADDPRIITTPVGLRIEDLHITGYTYDPNPLTDIDYQVVANFTSGDNLTVGGPICTLICFAEGTLILTLSGPKPVEELCLGDRVVTRDHGAQPVRWIGSTRISAAGQLADPKLAPVVIEAGALGKDLPERTLRVSRQHRILIRDWRAEMLYGAPDGVLVPAASLINDTTVRPVPGEDVTYYHVAFADHEVIYAEGLECESFHPSAASLGLLAPEAREELLRFFPHLANGIEALDNAVPASRVELRVREGAPLAR